ncbi:hypothetical protein Rm378p004 [Rhodothermus phage RM378]|uniref:hypothetical protein n=1 Tax=Rhodothermus phage RM378 TaxID=148943 RepID=UPI000018F617|nr:hypothetical protein Rm378p004 [Rhodothermus phage RM378]
MMQILKDVSRSVPRAATDPEALFEGALNYFYQNRNETLLVLAEGICREAARSSDPHIHIERELEKIRVQIPSIVEYLIWDGGLEDTISAGTIRFLDYMTVGGIQGVYMTLASLVALMVLDEVYPGAKVFIHMRPSSVKVYR